MESFRIAVLGGGGVGKNCVILRMTCDTDSVPKIRDLFDKNILFHNKWYRLVVINTAGHDEMHRITNLAIKSADTFVLTYSCTSQLSLQELQKFYHCAEQATDPIKPKVVVVGNKCDLIDERSVTDQQGRQFAESLGAPWIECSAKTNINIDKILISCLEQLVGVASNGKAKVTSPKKADEKGKGEKDHRGRCDVA
jgi:small GTP-binding protein